MSGDEAVEGAVAVTVASSVSGAPLLLGSGGGGGGGGGGEVPEFVILEPGRRVGDVAALLPETLAGHEYRLLLGEEVLDNDRTLAEVLPLRPEPAASAVGEGDQPARLRLTALVSRKANAQEQLDMGLIEAAGDLDAKLVDKLLAAGASATFLHSPEGVWGSEDQKTALHAVFQRGTDNIEARNAIVKALLAAGADVNAKRVKRDWRGCGNSKSAFEMLGFDVKDASLFSMFLAAGANPNTCQTQQRNSMSTSGRSVTPMLCKAVSNESLEITKALLDAGATVDAVSTEKYRNEHGYDRDTVETALHVACRRGNLLLASLLLERGADANIQRKYLEIEEDETDEEEEEEDEEEENKPNRQQKGKKAKGKKARKGSCKGKPGKKAGGNYAKGKKAKGKPGKQRQAAPQEEEEEEEEDDDDEEEHEEEQLAEHTDVQTAQQGTNPETGTSAKEAQTNEEEEDEAQDNDEPPQVNQDKDNGGESEIDEEDSEEEDDPEDDDEDSDTVRSFPVRETALHIALQGKHLRLVALLILAGADGSASRHYDKDTSSPLKLCAGDAGLLRALDAAAWTPEQVLEAFPEDSIRAALPAIQSARTTEAGRQ